MAGPGETVTVVGDGVVGPLAMLAAKQMGAERILAMSRHEMRQQLAREFGATDIVTELSVSQLRQEHPQKHRGAAVVIAASGRVAVA